MTSSQALFFITLFSGFNVACPVQDKFDDYPCPDGKLEYVVVYNSTGVNISCEHNWDFEQTSIADLHSKKCLSPCLKVSPGEIRLAQCINVTLNILCIFPDHVVETRVHFRGKPSSSQGQKDQKEELITTWNYHIGLWFFAAAVGAVLAGCAFWFIKQRPRSLCQTGLG